VRRPMPHAAISLAVRDTSGQPRPDCERSQHFKH